MEVLDLSREKQIEKLLETLPPTSKKLDYTNIIQSAIYELDFLREIDEARYFYDKEFLRRSVYRYEKHWLPFVQAHSDNEQGDLELCPPIDIHWVWHVHMLAPVAYSVDCKTIVKRVIAHSLQSKQEWTEKRKKTEGLWNSHFQFNVPFNLDPKMPAKEVELRAISDFKSSIKYNISAAALRQGVFYYQVSLDHFRYPSFLRDAVTRYRMYLYLKRKHKEKFLVPCYDMDLIWHTHQVHPFEYQKDTTSVLGFVLKHDDSVNDRSEGSKLNTSDDETRKLWAETFGVAFARPGSMFRGNPPQSRLFDLTPRYQKALLAPKEMDVELNSVEMSSLPGKEKAILTVQLETGSNFLKKKCIDLYSSECSLSDGGEEGEGGGGNVKLQNPDGLVHFAVSHSNCPKLNLKLASKPSKKTAFSWFGNGRRASIALSETPIDLFALTSFNGVGSNSSSSSEDGLSISHRLTINSKEACQDYILSELKLNLTNERLGRPTESKFHIQPGSFYDCIIPEDVESLWGPIPLQRLPRGVSNKCRAVTHG